MGRTFVLVHGAWHGGWCYRKVADLLRACGHRVFTPTLTGLAERSHLLSRDIDVDLHATDILNVLRWEELDDVTLVGHSYGGMVIAAAAEQAAAGAIGAIMFVDAFVPQDGECVLDLTTRSARDVAKWTKTGFMPPIPAATFGVNPADRDRVDELCTPHPFKCFTQKLELSGAYERIARKAYIFAQDGRFTRFADRLAERSDWTVVALHGGHDLMLDAPVALADTLHQLAAERPLREAVERRLP